MLPSPDRLTRTARLREVAILFLRLGFTAFGGPAVHTAMMEDEAVRRRGWLDRTHFLDLVAALNFIPGPNSTELAIQLGYIRAGFPGLVVAGVCFIGPAVLIILPIAWAYVRYGSIPRVQGMLEAVNAAVVALLLVMVVRLTRTAVKDAFTGVLAGAALIASFAMDGRVPFQPELAILAAAAFLGAVRRTGASPGAPVPAGSAIPAATAATAATAASAGAAALTAPSLANVFLVFLKIGGTLFGSGYVLVSYLRTEMVERRGWLTTPQLLDAVAVGQITPGPLLTTATFVGYVLGDRASHGSPLVAAAGALTATAGIFLPSFLLVAVTGPLLPKLRRNAHARNALDAMNAAVVALILFVTIQLAARTLAGTAWGGGGGGGGGGIHFAFRPFALLVALFAFVALVRFNVNATWVMLAAAITGLIRVTV